MQAGRDIALGPVRTEIASARCDGEPVCTWVIALCASEAW